MPSDADLARACCRGDTAAFGELIRRCTPMVCAVAYAATHDRALAEDVAQETFLAAWRDAAALRDPAAVRPWLCRIARNLAHKARRTRVHEQLVDRPAFELADARTAFDALHDAQVERAVAAALAAVPEPYREALVLFYFEQRSAKSVSEALGVSEDVVHKRVSRGRRYLAADLDELADTALRRPPRRDFSACVLALLPHQTPAKGSVMWKLALIATAGTMATLAGSSNATPPAPRAAPHTVAAAQPPAPPATHAPAPPSLPASECTTVARHLVAITRAANTTPERVALTTDHLDALCQRLAWQHGERACLLAATDKRGIEFCRDAAEHRPGSRDAVPVAAIHAVDCPTLGDHVADVMVAELDGTGQDNIEASLITDRDELHREVRDQCVEADWAEELRSCFAAATTMRQIVRCRLAYDAYEI